MAIAKVILNGVTQMDVTQKSVTAGSMLSGTTALKNDGTDITGNIASKTSSDMTVSGATVTAPAGYYASNASKSVASGSAKTPATTITANPSISVNSSGLITATVSKTQSVTPTVSAGYVASGTAGTITVSGSGTSQLTTQAAQTIHPSTTDQTIASGRYLTGAQTIKAVTTTNLTAANIVQGVTVKVGDSTDDDCVSSVTGTAETGGDDFVITLTKNTSTGIYEPDCTFAEAQAAYSGGKTIASVTNDGRPCSFAYDGNSNGFVYFVYTSYSGSNWRAVGLKIYLWTSTGVIVAEDPEQTKNITYFTSNATATPADVASGKVFYNADGYQVGTASQTVVSGTFMFDSSGDKRVNIPYSGNGYPVTVSIFVTEGIKDTSTTWYQTVKQYAVGQYTFVKAKTATAPTYTTSSSNLENAGYMFAIYKKSTSDATSLSSNSYDSGYVDLFTSASPSPSYARRVMSMPNATTMLLCVGYSQYSFEVNVEYTYVISYSE